jgi:signal peptidase I
MAAARREGSRAARRRAPEPGKPSAAGEWLKTIVLTAILLVVIRGFLVQTFVIVSGSMEDTLLIGDFLMVNRLALGTRIPGTTVLTPGYSEPHRGDVLVFDPPHEEGIKLVKRLIGMPGDTLQMRDGRLQINGSFVDEPYTKRGGGSEDHHVPEMLWQLAYLLPEADSAAWTPTRDNWGPIAIPEGHYFMLGDNRDGSQDSRYWGLLERWRLEGRAMFFYFSYNRGSAAPFAFLREIRWDRIGDPVLGP